MNRWGWPKRPWSIGCYQSKKNQWGRSEMKNKSIKNKFFENIAGNFPSAKEIISGHLETSILY